MARRLRLQFENAMYHVINRGNYRRDVFATVGSAGAFAEVLDETCERYQWQVHAYVIMRNHFHLALSTPRANLVEGMHWLQGTFAVRFNRLRVERGHLFQGRYQALLIEDAAALSRVVDYVHLNPVRENLIPVEQLGNFRWSSLRHYVAGARPGWLNATAWLDALGGLDTTQGWRDYVSHLSGLNADPKMQEAMGFDAMTTGWAIGTDAWRKALAQTYAHLALSPGLTGAELQVMKQSRWRSELATALTEAGKSAEDAIQEAKSARWKIQIARRLRRSGAPCAWIAEQLHMGPPGSMRVYLSRESHVNK